MNGLEPTPMKSNIIQIDDLKFKLGHLVSTTKAAAQIPHREIDNAIRRHAVGDWGDLCEEDVATNEYSLKHEGRLMSVYKTDTDITFWIITEWDRSVTTVLLPEDY